MRFLIGHHGEGKSHFCKHNALWNLFIAEVLLLCTNCKYLALWPSAGPDYSCRPRSLRVNYSTLRSLVGADRVPPVQFVPTFEVLCLGMLVVGRQGAGGGASFHTYSWRGGLRVSCYVWVMKSSAHPPPNTHTHTDTPSPITFGFHGVFIHCVFWCSSWFDPHGITCPKLKGATDVKRKQHSSICASVSSVGPCVCLREPLHWL